MTDPVVIPQVLMKKNSTGSHVVHRCLARVCLSRNHSEISFLFSQTLAGQVIPRGIGQSPRLQCS
jgi:hypothetical protein